MATTSYYLDLRSKAKDGKGNLVIAVRHNNTSTVIPTGIRLSPNEWDGKGVINNSVASVLNARIAQKKGDIDKAIAFLSIEEGFDFLSAAQIKEKISSNGSKNNHIRLVCDVFDEYMEQDLKPKTKETYKITLKKIHKFSGGDFRIDQITIKWLYKFESYLAKTQSVNGRAIYLRCLRAICKYAKKMRYIDQYPFEDFSVKQAPTDNRCIPIEKLRELYCYPVSKKCALYRDYFFLMFFLIGINAVDLFYAKKSQVINGRLEYIRRKTGKKYSIKIEPEAQEIIDRHAGKEYLVDVMEHCVHYESFTNMINKALILIGEKTVEEIPAEDDLFGESRTVEKVKPLIPGISTYWSRHTWSTLAAELNIPIDVISQALGHSIANKTTMIYVKFDRNKIDAANRKVIDYLLMK